MATVLIESNELWYLHLGSGDENAAAETFRSNLDRTVRELTQSGAIVVVVLPDDQSLILRVGDQQTLTSRQQSR